MKYLHSNFQGVIITPLVGVNLTLYSEVIFYFYFLMGGGGGGGGVILTPKMSLKNSFSGVKMTPDIEKLK